MPFVSYRRRKNMRFRLFIIVLLMVFVEIGCANGPKEGETPTYLVLEFNDIRVDEITIYLNEEYLTSRKAPNGGSLSTQFQVGEIFVGDIFWISPFLGPNCIDGAYVFEVTQGVYDHEQIGIFNEDGSWAANGFLVDIPTEIWGPCE